MSQTNSKALSADELSVLCWQLSLLSRAGVPWSESADVLLEDAQSPQVRRVLEDLREPLSDGKPLSIALGETGACPPYLLQMVEIGQASGRMDQVLTALSDYYRREAATLDAVRRAVTYPAIMAALVALVFLVLVARVLPVFSQVFSQMGASMSPMALFFVQADSFGRYAAYVLAGALLLGAVVMLVMFRGDRGMKLFSKGQTAESVARGRFSSAMALMLQSGLPMDEAMDRTGELLTETPIMPQFNDCRRRMTEGQSFPKAVEESGLLTGLQAGLLSAGFRAGASEQAMEELARRCQAEADDRLSRLLSRFEYSLVIVLCVAVGLVLLSVMLPLLGVLSAIGG